MLLDGREFTLLQLKMQFQDFALLKVDFSINQEFDESKKETPINPQIAINHELNENNKELVVGIGLRQINGNLPYHFEIKGAGLFKLESIPDAKILKQLATINCPAIIFPYLRETVADLTRRAGFPPLHINPINFIELAKQQEGAKKAKKKKVAKKKKS